MITVVLAGTGLDVSTAPQPLAAQSLTITGTPVCQPGDPRARARLQTLLSAVDQAPPAERRRQARTWLRAIDRRWPPEDQHCVFAHALARYLPIDFADPSIAPPSAKVRARLAKRAAALPPTAAPHDRLVPLQTLRLELLVEGPQAALERARAIALVLDPDLARVLSQIASRAVILDDLATAIEALTLARRLDPLEVAHRVDLAAVRLAQGQALTAANILQTVVESGQADATAQRLLSQARLSLGESEAAYAALLAVAQNCPEPQAYRCAMDLARLSLQSDRPSRGLAPVEQAITLTEGSAKADAYLLKARLHIALDERPEARHALARCLELRPEDATARAALAALTDETR